MKEGFVQGRNHPDDARIMSSVARKFGGTRYMREAIDLWGQADEHIERLQNVVVRLHREVSSGQPIGGKDQDRCSMRSTPSMRR